MVIVPDDSWSAPSLSSVRTAPNSVATIRTPWKLLMWCWSSKRPPPKRASIVPHKSRLPGERFLQVVVVDEPRLANSRRDHGESARLLKGSRVNELRVLGLDQRLEREPGRQTRAQPDRVALPRRVDVGGLAEGGADDGRSLALLGAEEDVARAEGQPVRLPHRRHGADLHAQVEISDQAFHHRQLLRILLAEVRAVGIYRREQLRDHRGHALEVPRPGRALEPVGDAADADAGARVGRIHLVRGRTVNRLDLRAFEHPQIARPIPRVAIQ